MPSFFISFFLVFYVFVRLFSETKWRFSRRQAIDVEEKLKGVIDCTDSAGADIYLNLPQVRRALHVRPQSEIGEWKLCELNSDEFNYVRNVDYLLPFYKEFFVPNIRILIYSGDVDSCVPFTFSANWVRYLNATVTKPWYPWVVNGQVAGYSVVHEPDFIFATVKGRYWMLFGCLVVCFV
eukprot:m.42077 g.42077  ORF g.42077 m.42077 type:complete len:180 (-) comp10489_c1_seq1:4713-5252(-)